MVDRAVAAAVFMGLRLLPLISVSVALASASYAASDRHHTTSSSVGSIHELSFHPENGENSQAALRSLRLGRRARTLEAAEPAVGEETTLLYSDFDSDTGGFTYQDDIFRGTNEPDYADGFYDADKGRGSLYVVVGNVDKGEIHDMSGGWVRPITLPEPATTLTLELVYRTRFSHNYDDGEYSEVLYSIDDILLGDDVDTSVLHINNMNGEDVSGPWRKVTITSTGRVWSQGDHTIKLGLYNNLKTRPGERTRLWIRELTVKYTASSDSLSTPPPSPAPTLSPAWEIVDTDGLPTARHEACFVMVNEKGYLIGGRKIKPVDEYDPVTRKWTEKTGPGIELHHMQCVAYKDEVFIVSSWTGKFPRESNVNAMYVYNTVTDTWSTDRTPLPLDRQRGGAASILVGDEIYVSHGNIGGHGKFATALGWLDKYDILTDTWTTNLTDAPNPRDHTGGAMVSADRFCVAGGRDGGEKDFFDLVVLPTDCYNITSGEWEVEADIPQGRAGSAYGQTCDNKLIVAGGEGFGQAWDNVDVFDGKQWRTLDSLNQARHGSGLAVSCACNQIHVASGSGSQGGSPELSTVETLFPQGENVACSV